MKYDPLVVSAILESVHRGFPRYGITIAAGNGEQMVLTHLWEISHDFFENNRFRIDFAVTVIMKQCI